MSLSIRPAVHEDAAAIAVIYNQGIAERGDTLEIIVERRIRENQVSVVTASDAANSPRNDALWAVAQPRISECHHPT